MDYAYSNMIAAREECVRRFGGIFALPILPDDPIHSIPQHAHHVKGDLLDFGAGSQHLKSILAHIVQDMNYYSLDADKQYSCTWKNLKEIPTDKHFLLIYANQVFEHIPIDAALQIMEQLAAHLAPNGLFMATVPNVSHPVRFAADIDHCSYVSYTDLYYLCRHANLEVNALYRYSKCHPKGWQERWLAKLIQKVYRMDWADSICIFAHKNNL